MQHPLRRTCPPWCVADHTLDDDGGRLRHRGPTAVIPGILLSSAPPHDAHAIELLVEVYAYDGDPLVAVYIGDGVDGIDLTTETAGRLVRRLGEALRVSGASAM